MKVPLLKAEIEHFKKTINTARDHQELFMWECLKNFRSKWNLEELDFLTMYSNSFKSSMSNRLWKGVNYDPLKVMLEFISIDKEFVRAMFRDLYDESKDLMMRIGRFLFHCDMMLDEIKVKSGHFNSHYHSDYKMISVYLSFQYPDKYCVYEYHPYCTFMKKVGALKEPLENELPKFFILMKSIYQNFISKDEELMQIHQNRFYDNKFYLGNNLLISSELYLTRNN